MKASLPILALALASLQLQANASDLVAPGAKPVKLAGGFKFTEGPAVDENGNILQDDLIFLRPENPYWNFEPEEEEE